MNKFFTKENVSEYSLLIGAILIPVLALGYFFVFDSHKGIDDNVTEVEEVTKKKENPFDDTQVVAQAALVTELNTGRILYAKGENEKQPIASITKLFTSLVASEKLNRIGKNNILIKEDYLTPPGDWGLAPGDTWDIKDLIDFTLLTSSNDGAKALAVSAFGGSDDSKFVSEMNNFSRKLGLANTYFLNETGLDINFDTEAGAYSDAADVTKILKYITFTIPELFDGTKNKKEEFFVGDKFYDSENTNTVVNKLPGLIISKTGYTNIAGGNLAVVVDTGLNNPVSIVVLGSTKEGRFEDVLKLYEKTIDFYVE